MDPGIALLSEFCTHAFLQVIGQGNVLLHQASFQTNIRTGVKSMTVTIPIDKAGVPRVKILGVIAREDGELVADLIEIPVKCQLEHEVRREEAEGERIEIMNGERVVY